MYKKQIFQATIRLASENNYEFKHGFQVGDVVEKYGHGDIKSESHGNISYKNTNLSLRKTGA